MDPLVRQRPRQGGSLPLAEFRQPGARVGGVQLAENVTGRLAVADEQEPHLR